MSTESNRTGCSDKLTGGGLNLRYAYTADDERILEFDATAFQSVWRLRDLGGQVIREFRQNTATGAMSWQKDCIRRGTQPVAAVDATEGTRHLHPDHLGTTCAITDSVGTHRNTYHFDPYGEMAASFTPGTETMLFTGHERDDHRLTGGGGGTTDDLDYMHARYYNPMLGRFLRVDPVRQLSATRLPRKWNRYAYALSSPAVFLDPDGRDPLAAALGGELLVFGGGGSAAGTVGAGSAGIGATVAGGSTLAVGGVVVVGGGIGVVVGRGIGSAEIGGRSVDDRISDVMAEVILAVTSRDKPVAPGRGEPVPTAIPGARGQETSIPVPEVPTAEQPPNSEDLAELLVDEKKKTLVDAIVEGLGQIFGVPTDRTE